MQKIPLHKTIRDREKATFPVPLIPPPTPQTPSSQIPEWNMSLIRVRIHEGLIYILQIVLDLIIRRADDRLEAKSADQ